MLPEESRLLEVGLARLDADDVRSALGKGEAEAALEAAEVGDAVEAAASREDVLEG